MEKYILTNRKSYGTICVIVNVVHLIHDGGGITKFVKSHKRNIEKVLILLISVLVITVSIIIGNRLYQRGKYVTTDFKNIDLTGIDSIMIVAHPDDEILWGGSHLIDGNYLVVCITAGNNSTRAEELIKAMQVTNDKCIMLGYSDKMFNKRSNWKYSYDDIQEDLSEILSLKKWKMIVTHNSKGEYGLIHHIKTNKIVTDIYEQNFMDDSNLYYFGEYYNKNEIKDAKSSLTAIDKKNYQIKLDIIENIYVSQDFLMDKFGHTIEYEYWNKYIE